MSFVCVNKMKDFLRILHYLKCKNMAPLDLLTILVREEETKAQITFH